jgi:hypothetical protein
MRENTDDFFDDAETVKSFRFETVWLKQPSAQKCSPYKNPFKIWTGTFFERGLSSVRHVQFVCTSEIGIGPVNSKL